MLSVARADLGHQQDFALYVRSSTIKKVTLIKQRRLLDAFFKVDEAVLRHERFDGSLSPELNRLCLERGDGVTALLYQPQSDSLVLVRQFRYPAWVRQGPGWILETVAGMLDKAEAPQETMRREILEETGYQVCNLQHVSTFYLTPGGSSERIFLYYGEVAVDERRESGGGLADENEDIEVIEIAVDDAFAAVDQGEIVDAKTLIALMWFRNRRLQT